jgi:hypothetical protein
MSFGRNGLDLIRQNESSLDRDRDACTSCGWIETRRLVCCGSEVVERTPRHCRRTIGRREEDREPRSDKAFGHRYLAVVVL